MISILLLSSVDLEMAVQKVRVCAFEVGVLDTTEPLWKCGEFSLARPEDQGPK